MDQELEQEKHNIVNIDSSLHHLAGIFPFLSILISYLLLDETNNTTTALKEKINSLTDLLFAEENSKLYVTQFNEKEEKKERAESGSKRINIQRKYCV